MKNLAVPFLRLAVLSFGLFACVNLSASEPEAKPRGTENSQDDALARLNVVCRQAYARARSRILERSGPVVLSIGDDLVLIDGDQKKTVTVVPPLFHHLKAVSHVPLAIFAVLDEAGGRELSESERTDLVAIQGSTRAALDSLSTLDFTEQQLNRQTTLLKNSNAFIETALTWKKVSAAEVTRFARELTGDLMRNANEAARLKLDAYDRQLRVWWNQLSAEEKETLTVVVVGASTPRQGNLAVQFFARVIGVEGEGPRIIYAESLFDAQKALELAGTHLIDRRVASGFFADPRRMNRDLFSDFTTQYLRGLKPYSLED